MHLVVVGSDAGVSAALRARYGVERVEALTARGLGSEIAERIDIVATAIHCGLTVDPISDLDLTYTPPLGSRWDALQIDAQAWADDCLGTA